MKEIIFRYVYQHNETGRISCKEYDIEHIEHALLKVAEGWGIIARCLYTGIKDKNGKKIFEGDIVKFNNDDWLNDMDEIQVVEFKEAGFRPFCGLNDGGSWCEVIGNIYENPELLK